MDAYSWSFNKDESYFTQSGESVEDCINQALNCLDRRRERPTHIYIGENIEFVPSVDVAVLLDDVAENAYNQCGEAAENWLNSISIEAKDNLSEKMQAVFDAWLDKIGEKPYFYSVSPVVPYKLPTT